MSKIDNLSVIARDVKVSHISDADLVCLLTDVDTAVLLREIGHNLTDKEILSIFDRETIEEYLASGNAPSLGDRFDEIWDSCWSVYRPGTLSIADAKKIIKEKLGI